MNPVSKFLAGAAAAAASRAALPQIILMKLRRDLRQLNAGDHGPLLAGYADGAILHFNEGPHRWSGEHRGKPAIERFLRNFTGAGLQGEIETLWVAGAPWALRIAIRLDDHANEPGGKCIYANRSVLVVRTRWGKIVDHADFFEDTGRILELEQELTALGVAPA